jgi:uncharacterized protein YaiL (DUF2058 family)
VSESLRDQLVKAGLATASQAKKAERQAKAEQHANRGDKPGKPGKPGKTKQRKVDPNSPEAVKARARKQQAEKRARDKALAETRNERAAAKALRAEIKQIISQNEQRKKETSDEDVPYQFVHGKKIKKIYVPPSQREQLIKGSLVVVNNDGLYSLVTKDVAEQIRARDPKRIITGQEEKEDPEPGSDDEYYAQFEVPDDLDW